tara:strand:+ start:293 stop:724 length:432 start_codon:yes stop_codon:yes gene_type:complete
MNNKVLYQLRIYFSSEFTNLINSNLNSNLKLSLNRLLKQHNAELLSQYDGFVGYVKEAEKNGIDKYPLYHWTNDSLKNKSKIEKYRNSYTIYINNEEVYMKSKADNLEKQLESLIDGNFILRISKHDTNPENNPQPPKKYISK